MEAALALPGVGVGMQLLVGGLVGLKATLWLSPFSLSTQTA